MYAPMESIQATYFIETIHASMEYIFELDNTFGDTCIYHVNIMKNNLMEKYFIRKQSTQDSSIVYIDE